MAITPQQIISKKQAGEKIVSLTAYDYSTAKLIDQTEAVDFILVGDSLGMVVLGYPDTVHVTMADMLHHVKAVARGVSRSLVVADMPFLSVHVDLKTAVENCGRMLQEGSAQAVKIEGASEWTLQLISRLTEMGIPVMGHLGYTPQSINTLGIKVQAKTMEAAETLIQDAQALEAAGAFAVVLEMVPTEVSALVSRMLTIPTIGIGAGPNCDGQILVLDDFLGRYPDFTPKFARRYMQFSEDLKAAIQQYAIDIIAGDFPHIQNESFHFPADQLENLQAYETSEKVKCKL